MATEIGVFAKHWRPGHVKTRLAASIGDGPAASIARAFLATLLRRLSATADERVVGFAPADARSSFADLAGQAWRLEPQVSGDLGDRMRGHFERATANPALAAVLLGSDSPNLPLARVQEAFDRLESARLVLGPTDDGGYYLIGGRGGPPPVFNAMPWSTPRLFSATLERLDTLGWRRGREYEVLPTWYDVDTADDLARLRSDLADADEPALRALAIEITEILP